MIRDFIDVCDLLPQNFKKWLAVTRQQNDMRRPSSEGPQNKRFRQRRCLLHEIEGSSENAACRSLGRRESQHSTQSRSPRRSSNSQQMSAEIFAPTWLESIDDKDPNHIINLFVTFLRDISESNQVWGFDHFLQNSVPRHHT